MSKITFTVELDSTLTGEERAQVSAALIAQVEDHGIADLSCTIDGESSGIVRAHAEPPQVHSPGPWEMQNYTNSNKWFVAPVGGGPVVFETTDYPEGMANGRLIAAGPCMLEALRTVWQYLETNCLGQGEVQRQVYEAILKAEER